MRVDGGSNCRYFWYKHLFYILFVRPISVHVSGVFTFSTDGMGLVPVKFPSSHTLHSMAPAYWTPTYLKKTLSLSTLKLYSGFHGASHESLSCCTFRYSQGHTLTVNKTRITTLATSISTLSKKDQSHPKGIYGNFRAITLFSPWQW